MKTETINWHQLPQTVGEAFDLWDHAQGELGSS
jgi:hypothetical protein